MPRISTVGLAVEIDGSARSDCVVDYTITFDEVDLALNLPFKETCRLWGADGSFPGDDDNPIPNGVLRNSTVRPDGHKTVTRHLSKSVSNSDLDEDSSFFNDNDEIYAEVRLQAQSPLFPAVIKRKSAEVHGEF